MPRRRTRVRSDCSGDSSGLERAKRCRGDPGQEAATAGVSAHQKLYVNLAPSTRGLIGVCATMKLSVLVKTIACELVMFCP